MARGGVNVDECVRYAEAAMCGDCEKYACKIASILDENTKVRIFRGKCQQEIQAILKRLADQIRKMILCKYYDNVLEFSYEDLILHKSSNDNKKGADLYHEHLKTHEKIDVEVKFGEKTDRNIGMKLFKDIFACDAFDKALSLPQRKEWETLFSYDRDEHKQLERLWQRLNKAINEFNGVQRANNFILPESQQALMEARILNATGRGDFHGKFLKVELDGDEFEDLKTIPTGIGKWIVEEVMPIDGVSVTRCNVFTRNYDTNVQIKYVLNWKNNYRLKKSPHDKVSAKLGLGSSSWNVWVDVFVTKIQ